MHFREEWRGEAMFVQDDEEQARKEQGQGLPPIPQYCHKRTSTPGPAPAPMTKRPSWVILAADSNASLPPAASLPASSVRDFTVGQYMIESIVHEPMHDGDGTVCTQRS